MDVAALAQNLISMSATKTQFSANVAVLRKQFEMQKMAVDMLVPTPPPPAPGTGRLVDKFA
ncbi:MAG TPA: putative motility protein [Devosiaceae bacterium]|jgi:hypothetical protein|nr:putative motility protein [Devosiaceae bacterium]